MKILTPLIVLILILISNVKPVTASPFESIINELTPFSTDGCSIVPDFDFTSCCVAHDLDYWKGGTEEQRLTADKNLRLCIKEKSNSLMASIYYWGVRMGGGPDILSTYRWGYGWKYPREYGELNEDEKMQVARLDPGDIYSYPIIDSEKNYAHIPMIYKNYCLAEIHQKLNERYQNQDVSVKKMRVETDHYFTKVKIWINNSDKVIVTYQNRKYEQCQRLQYFKFTSHFYMNIKFK